MSPASGSAGAAPAGSSSRRRAGRLRAVRTAVARGVRSVAVRMAITWLDRATARAEQRAGPRTRVLRPVSEPDRRPVRFLLLNARGMGGTIRTTFTTAAQLARRHDVEVVSVLRGRQEARIPVPEGLRIRQLFDRSSPRFGPTRLAARLLRPAPSRLWHPGDAAYRRVSLWTDVMVLRWLRGLSPGTVVIATRPALILLASRLAPAGVIVIAQEHQRLDQHPPALRDALRAALANASLMVTLTRTDRAAYEALLGTAGPPVVAIPNAVPDVALGPGDPSAHRLLAAGRLVPQKGFDLLLRAFHAVAERHPDWTLDIYGRGARRESLEGLVAQLGLGDRARVNPPTDRLGERMREASVYVLSSRFEGFPLILLEAMSAGLAVVAFDCPTGPGEIVTDGQNGLLVPPKDVAALAAALDRVMTDESLRRRLAAAAPASVVPYSAAALGRRWEAVLRGDDGPADPGTTSVNLPRPASRSPQASCGSPRAS